MGAFIVNFHARCESESPVRDMLALLAERAWIGPPVGGWVSFYEEIADMQNGDRIEELCQRVSESTNGPVIAFLVHDSDFLCYHLFENGQKRDEYNSCPGYFGDVAEMLPPGVSADEFLNQVRGDAETLAAICPEDVDRSAIERLLDVKPGEYIFAEEHLQKLAELIGIDSERAMTTYRDIGLEIPPADLDLEFVGTGTRPEPGEDSWQRSFQVVDGGAEPGTALALGEGTDVSALLGDLTDQISDPNQKLELAVIAKNEAGIRDAIAEGADLHARQATPLLTATGMQSEEVVRLLLELGADPAAVPEILGVAASTGNMNIAELLIQHGAEIHHINEFGWTALHFGVQPASPAMVQLLLNAGCDPTVRSENGGTAFELAEFMLRQVEALSHNAEASSLRTETSNGLRQVCEMLREAGG